MDILFVKLSSIGDVIHTLPALAAVKKLLPDSNISWVVERGSAEILRGNNMLSELIEIDTKTFRTSQDFSSTLASARKQFQDLRSPKFDLAIDFQGLLKSAAIAKFAKAEKRIGFSKESLREPASRFLLDESIDIDPKQNIILKNLALAEGALETVLNGKTLNRENLQFPIFTDQINRSKANEIAKKVGGKFAILNPAGGWETKLWAAEKYGKLADLLWSELGLASIISTTHAENQLAQRALAASKSTKTIVAHPSLKGFYELAKEAKIYIGGDTAPTHLAVAAKCPVVGIFGPTEWWRNGSIDPTDICVERNEIDCRTDCHRRSCDKWICMDIPVERVLDAVAQRLA